MSQFSMSRQRSHGPEDEPYQHHYGPTISCTPKSSGEQSHDGQGSGSTTKRKYDYRSYQEMQKRRRISPDRHRRLSSESRSSSNADVVEVLTNRNSLHSPIGSDADDSSNRAQQGLFCRLCSSDKQYKNDRDLATHLTIIHYRERILNRIKPPYECLNCGFKPPVNMSEDQTIEELLMHYGCDEKVATKYYQKDCSELPLRNKSGHNTVSTSAIVCGICNVLNDNERLFTRHITLRHFTKDLLDELPKRPPFRCPFIDCGQEKTTLHSLMLHYGCEHNVSMELYNGRHNKKDKAADINQTKSDKVLPNAAPSLPNMLSPFNARAESEPEKTSTNTNSARTPSSKQPSAKAKLFDMFRQNDNRGNKDEEPTCKKCKRTFVTAKSLKYHDILVHIFPKLASSGPYRCPKCSLTIKEKSDFTKHIIAKHWEECQSEVFQDDMKRRKSHHSSSNIKANVESKQKSTTDEIASIPQNKTRKTQHKVTELTARQRITQQWENSSFDGLKRRVEELEEQLKAADEAKKEAIKKKDEKFERWITQKESSLEEVQKDKRKLEARLEQAEVDMADAKKQLEQAQESYQDLEAKILEKDNDKEEVTKEKKNLEKTISNLKVETEKVTKDKCNLQESLTATEIKLTLAEEKIQDLEITVSEKEEEMKETNGNFEFQLAEGVKKISRLEKQVEFQKNKVDKINEEKKEKVVAMKELAKKHKETESQLKEQVNKLSKELKAMSAHEKKLELKQLEKDSAKVEQLQQQLNDGESQIELLETERNVLLESLDRLQRILKDFESILAEKNEKLKEASGKLEDAETNLEEALQRLKDQKGVDKEKRELNREVKQLRSTMKDWESRQFTNVKLIAGLEKENNELKSKLKDYEENNTGVEEELYEVTTKCKKMEKEGIKLKTKADMAEQEKAKCMARLEMKNEEVDTLKSKNLELDATIKHLEKEIRQNGGQSDALESLNTNIFNQQGEIAHLQNTLANTKKEVGDCRSENVRLVKQLELLKDRNAKFETDYSQLVTQYETLKKEFSVNRNLLVSKNKQLQDLRLQPPVVTSDDMSKVQVKEEIIDTDDLPPMPNFPNIPDSSGSEVPPEKTSCVDAGQKQLIFNVAEDLVSKEVKKEPIAEPSSDEEDIDVSDNVAHPDHRYSLPPVTATQDPLFIRQPSQSTFFSQARGPTTSQQQKNNTISEEMRSFFPSHETLSPLQFVGEQGWSKPGPASSKKKKKNVSLPNTPDVILEEEEAEEYSCGLCGEYDPPLQGSKEEGTVYTTEWVGCDCDRWFHKQCTKLSRFTDRFSCRSVKMKCIKPKKKQL